MPLVRPAVPLPLAPVPYGCAPRIMRKHGHAVLTTTSNWETGSYP